MADYYNCPKCGAEHRVNMYGMGRCPKCGWESNRAFPDREVELNANWVPPAVNAAKPIERVYMTFTTDSLGYNGPWDQKPE